VAEVSDASSASSGQEGIDLIYGIDDSPPLGEGILLGLQHYLTMLGATVVIPIILSGPLGIEHGSVDQALLISTMFFVSGIMTIIQVKWGNKLPIVQGGTFSFLAPTIAIAGMAALNQSGMGWEVRMQHVQGAIILGAIVEMIVGYGGFVGYLRKYFSPITIAPTVALIGLGLFGATANSAGKDWFIAGLTILSIIIFSQFLNRTARMFQLYPILFGIVVVWLFTILGSQVGWFPEGSPSHVDFSGLQNSPWITIPYPFQWAGDNPDFVLFGLEFGLPTFGFAAFIGMLAGYIASMVESIGDYYSCARLSGIPNPEDDVFNRGIGTEGLGCLIAGIMGTGNGTTSYSENIGAIGLTKVASRTVILYGAGLMIVLGAFGKFGAIFTTLPEPIVGGLYAVVFGMIAAVGISNLQFVDLNSQRNLFIIGFAFFMGLVVPEYFNGLPSGMEELQKQAPWLAALKGTSSGIYNIIATVGKTGMAVGAIIAFVLDNTVPGTDEERGLTEWTKASSEVT